MNKELAIEGLRKIQIILPSSFLLCGTLLGCIRDKKIIDWDNDMDFGVMFEDWSEEKIKELSSAGFCFLSNIFWDNEKAKNIIVPESIDKRAKVQMYYKEKNIRICLEVFSKGVGNYRYSCSSLKYGIFRIPEDLINNTVKYSFYDKLVNIPERYEDLLTYLYDDWKIPRRKYIGTDLHEKNKKKFHISLL